jgi:magnesium transporter
MNPQNDLQTDSTHRSTRRISNRPLSAYAVTVDAEGTRLRASEIAVFITGQALITIRKDDLFDIAPVLDRWDASADLAGNGVAFLLYGLLDHLVDGHFAAVQQLDDAMKILNVGCVIRRW